MQIHSLSFRSETTITETTESKNEFYLTKVHEKAFNQLKEAIVKDVTQQFFNQDLPLYIEVDVSKKGIGAVMLQPDKNIKNTSSVQIPNNLRPVTYASKTLTSCESNYSNIEREPLDVLFSVLHLKHLHMVTRYIPLLIINL